MRRFNLVMLSAAVFVACAIASPAFAWQLGGKEMNRLGTGARTKAFITVYYASLFVAEEQKGATAAQIIDADAPMSIIMRIDSRLVDKDSFVKAVREGFQKSAANGFTTPAVEQYLGFFNTVTIAKGDTFSQNYEPGKGLTVVYKSAQTGQSRVLGNVAGLQFKKAFFAMFLAQNPIDNGLKRGMMGR